jgi:hypothetical protein
MSNATEPPDSRDMWTGTAVHYTFMTIESVCHDSMTTDPWGRAIRDCHDGEQSHPLIQREGNEAREHSTEKYFEEFAPETENRAWLESWLDGPLLDIGAGAGALALYYQQQFETVAIEVSELLVEVMRERGVTDARHVDMFSLRDAFERDQFRSALASGTQVTLAGSMQGLREFFSDLAYVTTPDASVVFEGYDPECEGTKELLGYREDSTPGLAFRVLHFEYENDVGDTLLFRLFSPDRLREAVLGTGWEVAAIRHPSGNAHHYQTALKKIS